MTTVYDVLEDFRARARNTRELGDLFEQLIVGYLKTDPVYTEQFEDVQLWMDWPDRNGADTGIDIVARERETGGYCAIQCKFYPETHTIQKSDLDSFLSDSGKLPFTSRLFVSSTTKWGKNAEDAIRGQRIPVRRIGLQDLNESAIDWSQFKAAEPQELVLKAKKSIRPHQQAALDDVFSGFEEHDRGKLIMACGTGKTFTALKIVEELANRKAPTDQTNVLFLVPSISLIQQTLREWTTECSLALQSFAVCSDVKVGRGNTIEDISVTDLAFPATTDTRKLLEQISAVGKNGVLRAIFSTYQSIAVVAQAQREGLPTFDLIICDEAHRTTGVKLAGDEDASAFVKVHDQNFIKAKKRLYMTATPRLYDEGAKSKATQKEAVVWSMDDPAMFGPEFHRLGFGQAVGDDLLSDYRVLILAVDEKYIETSLQSQVADRNSEISLEDTTKIVGCWNGLAKRSGGMAGGFGFGPDEPPMHRAVAFSRTIAESKALTTMFNQVLREYADANEGSLRCDVQHVDGTQNALVRGAALDWLKTEGGDDECKILSNARCLSEGVDVPNLDAVLFLNPRNSQVDVVQAVGRVMRKAPGKTYGYIILPIAVPKDLAPDEALSDNKRYAVVWQILQALRAHDDRFNATINKIDLNKRKPRNIMVGTVGFDNDGGDRAEQIEQMAFDVHVEEWREAIYAKIVEKVGERTYWEFWARDIALIAERHTEKVKASLAHDDNELARVFSAFLTGLRRNLNDSITEDQAIEMLSQHQVTRPVFEALFEDYSFASSNPVSVVMQQVLDALDRANVVEDVESLEPFYESVRRRATDIDNPEGKQRIIIELYEKFFKLAFPRTAASLGIVYTPVEIVDFIIRSVQRVLETEFGASVGDRNVHVLDPFTGTGTFIVRLIQNGVIPIGDLKAKYTSELWANEIVLLAYYIGCINIEAAYHGVVGGEYQPFEGIVLTDTFQSTEFDDKMDEEAFFPQNNERLVRQKAADIRVIMANPPYSVGQGSQNDNNQNLVYPTLDRRIDATYAARSKATLKRNLFDSYVRAFRWASDRLGERGVLCFVSNGSFIDSNSLDGFRKSVVDEFSTVYCLNLRGNQRTKAEESRREGGKVFGSGSRAQIAITLLVKNPDQSGPAKVEYHDIGDYLSREDKLAAVAKFGNVDSIPWERLVPDVNGDWINQRDEGFSSYAPLGDKRGGSRQSIFNTYSLGVATNRDAWAYNFSRESLAENMGRMVAFYNEQVTGMDDWLTTNRIPRNDKAVDEYINRAADKISWTRALKGDLRKGKPAEFSSDRIVVSMYRPFCKQWLYFDRQMNEMVLQMPKLFPTPDHENRVIAVSGVGAGANYSVLMTDAIPCLTMAGAGNAVQCFPLYHYEEGDEFGAFGGDALDRFVRRDGITDTTLVAYQDRYGGGVTKDDIFHYIYGILHSPEYTTRYASDLGKAIPRIPFVEAFAGYVDAGRELAKWHLGYEAVEPWPLEGMPDAGASARELRVEKMRFARKGKATDKSTLIFNDYVTLSGIPEQVDAFMVNGRSTVEWLIDRYQVTTDKDSRIVNDPNAYASDPRYIVDLVARMVRVAIESAQIVGSLPPLEIVDSSSA